jgi:serine/threonine protein kinase
MTAVTERRSAALFGRYRIERHLGECGMASVCLAEDSKHDRKAALKLLKPAHGESAEAAARRGIRARTQQARRTYATVPFPCPFRRPDTAIGRTNPANGCGQRTANG